MKNNTQFDKEQTAAISAGVTGMVNAINNLFEGEIQPIINSLKSEDVIGESDTKEPLMATIAQVEQGVQAVVDKLGRMQKAIDAVCEATGVAVNKNIQNTEEATQVVAAAKKKVEESTGKNS